MSVQEMRAEAKRLIDEVDEQSLASFLAQHGDPEKVFVPGEPGVTIAQYNREIDEAMARIDAGHYTTQDEVDKYFQEKYGFDTAQ